MKAIISKHPVLFVIAAALLFQFAIVGTVGAMLPEGAHIHDDEAAHMIFRFRLFGPLIMAVAVTWIVDGRAGLRNLFASFLHWRVPARWYALAFSWKFMFTYTGIAVLALIGVRAWPGWIVPDFFGGDWSALLELLRNMPFIVAIAIVEETTWMKCCVTRMQERYSALVSCLVVGISWGLWYLPMLLIREGVPDGYPWPLFMLSMFSLTVFLSWTYNMTRSGTILLIMQIVSNCAFFIIPVLPGWWGLDPTYVNSFVYVNFASAVTLLLVFGWRDLSTRGRARWSDGMPEAGSMNVGGFSPSVA